MTRRRATGEKYSALQRAQYRLRAIAANLRSGAAIDDDTRQFLGQALDRIGRGEDANEVLGLSVGKGQRRTPEQTIKPWLLESQVRLIASLMRPYSDDVEVSGPGLSLEDAAAEIAKDENGGRGSMFTFDTLINAWHDHPEWRNPRFSPPIEAEPIMRPRRLNSEPKS